MITNFLQFLNENRIKVEMPVPEDILKMKKEFTKAGKKLYIVGGAVRDFLKGKSPHDFDLVTDALPEESKQILKNWNVSDEQGKSFGVLRVFTKEEPLGHELATFRKDISKGRDTKGSDQKVEIGRNITIEDDVKRRDLTQNALFYDLDTKEIVDLVGGVDDIKNNRIAAVGEPSKRFEEDRLRILRAFRFASRNQSTIDPKTSEAIKNDNRLRGISSIDDVSQERIIDELFKTIDWCKEHNKIDSLRYYFELLKEYNMFNQMFIGLKVKIDKIETFNKSVLFASLFRDNNLKTLGREMWENKFPNKNPKYIDETVFLLRFKENLTDVERIPFLNKERNRINIPDYIIVDFSKIFNLNSRYVNAFLRYNPKIDGNELKKLGYQGSEIGKEIRRREIEEFQKLI